MSSPAANTLPSTWSAYAGRLHDWLESHQGQFTKTETLDPEGAQLAEWWRQQTTPGVYDALSEDDRNRLDELRMQADQLRNPALDWRQALEATAEYVRSHAGRFPPNRSADPMVAALGSWWVAQNIGSNHDRMTNQQTRQLDRLRAQADRLRAEAKRERAIETRQEARARGRAASIAAGRTGAARAREALRSPYLIPGDVEILQLRIDHPDLSLAELAELARTTPGRFASKWYGALRRGPNSASPLRRDVADRWFTPGEAAAELGVSRVTVSRWTKALLMFADAGPRGHLRYRGAEVLRVAQRIADGWPAEFADAAVKVPRQR
jgi:hypothetical protein